MGINPGNPAFALPPAEDDLSRQVKDLERTIRENLASVVASFKTTVERLDGAIADLQEVVNAQVTPWVSSGSASGFLATTTLTTFVNAPIAVPDGFTRALVFAGGQVSAGNSTNGDMAQIYANITINGIVGADSTASVASVLAATVPAFASASLTGLSGGFVSVALAARTSNGSSSPDTLPFDRATLTAQAIFLR